MECRRSGEYTPFHKVVVSLLRKGGEAMAVPDGLADLVGLLLLWIVVAPIVFDDAFDPSS